MPAPLRTPDRAPRVFVRAEDLPTGTPIRGTLPNGGRPSSSPVGQLGPPQGLNLRREEASPAKLELGVVDDKSEKPPLTKRQKRRQRQKANKGRSQQFESPKGLGKSKSPSKGLGKSMQTEQQRLQGKPQLRPGRKGKGRGKLWNPWRADMGYRR